MCDVKPHLATEDPEKMSNRCQSNVRGDSEPMPTPRFGSFAWQGALDGLSALGKSVIESVQAA